MLRYEIINRIICNYKPKNNIIMERKKLPKQKHKGLFIYCNRCKKNFSWTSKSITSQKGKEEIEEPICKKTKTVFSSCKFFEEHRYKVRIYIPDEKGKTRYKSLNAKNHNEAIIEAIHFEKKVRYKSLENKISSLSDFNILIVNAQIAYINYLSGIDVPCHLKKVRTQKHINSVNSTIDLFKKALSNKGIDVLSKSIIDINDEYIGIFHSFILRAKKPSLRTYNNKMSVLRTFIRWSIQQFNIPFINPFNKVKNRSSVNRKDILYKKEYKALLSLIKPELGKRSMKGKKRTTKRNWYRPYLKNSIELALYTGCRGKDLLMVKWNMIHFKKEKPYFIEIPNSKAEALKGEGFNSNVAPIIVPITKGLAKLLNKIGLKEKKGLNEYIIYPERTIAPSTILDNISKGFTHFYKQLHTGREITFKHLRKTYLTYLNATLKERTRLLSSHTSHEVLRRHYIDERLISKTVKKLNIFKT